MNRKLHNTILAFSVTGVMLFVGLVVADPALPKAEAPAPTMLPAVVDTPDDTAAPAEHSRAARAGTIEAIALGASLVALGVGEAALANALDELEAGPATQERTAERRQAAKRASSNSREMIAMPYFSFARGSRGSRS